MKIIIVNLNAYHRKSIKYYINHFSLLLFTCLLAWIFKNKFVTHHKYYLPFSHGHNQLLPRNCPMSSAQSNREYFLQNTNGQCTLKYLLSVMNMGLFKVYLQKWSSSEKKTKMHNDAKFKLTKLELYLCHTIIKCTSISN